MGSSPFRRTQRLACREHSVAAAFPLPVPGMTRCPRRFGPEERERIHVGGQHGLVTAVRLREQRYSVHAVPYAVGTCDTGMHEAALVNTHPDPVSRHELGMFERPYPVIRGLGW